MRSSSWTVMGRVGGGTRWRWEGSPCPLGNRLAWSPLRREFAPLFSTTRNIHPGFVGQWHHSTVGDFSAQGTLHIKSFVRIVCIYSWGILMCIRCLFVFVFFRIVCFRLAFWPGNKIFLIRPVPWVSDSLVLPPCI